MDLKDAHPLCLHWLPEILSCYERAFLPLPAHPDSLRVDVLNSTALNACWTPPDLKGGTLQYYRVFWKQLPNLPFFSSRPRLPFFTRHLTLTSLEIDDPDADGDSIFPTDHHDPRVKRDIAQYFANDQLRYRYSPQIWPLAPIHVCRWEIQFAENIISGVFPDSSSSSDWSTGHGWTDPTICMRTTSSYQCHRNGAY